ncbi:MAG: hypothetical protein KDA22_10655 [Phycisphaerales bacterium]|nr:hypothetical protein [Phycisphaerales bacterium]
MRQLTRNECRDIQLVAAVLAGVFLLLCFRWLSVASIAGGLAIAALLPRPWRRSARLTALLAAIVLSLAPIDVLPWNRPGPPRWVEVVFGHPGAVAVRRAQVGGLRLGGCTRSTLDAHYVFVW